MKIAIAPKHPSRSSANPTNGRDAERFGEFLASTSTQQSSIYKVLTRQATRVAELSTLLHD